MTCRDCIHHDACAELIKSIDNTASDWEETMSKFCTYFDEAPTNTPEVFVKDETTMDDYAALLVKLYAEYTRSTGYTDDDYAKAVAIAIRMLSD